MGTFLRFRSLLVVLFLGTAGFLGAQDLPAQPFSFRWLPVDGAGGYRAEIQDKSGKLVVNQQVQDEQNSLLVTLVPGSYTLRLTTLNRFLLPEGATDWVPIHVAAPAAPEVGEVPLLALNPGVSAPLTVSVKGLAQDATAALRSPTGTLIPLDLPAPSNGTVTLNLPPLTSRGNYSLVMTNPPKLTTSVSGKISVHYPVPVVASLDPKNLQTTDSSQPVQIKGGQFSPETVVTIKVGESGAPMQLALSTRSSSELTATIPPGLPPGEYLLSVANARDETAVDAGTLTLAAPPPPPVVQAPPPVVELPPKPVGPPGDPKVVVSTFSAAKEGELSFPTAITFKRFGATYVSDTYGNAIRAIYPNGEITTFVGSGKPGSSNGNGGQTAEFNKPTGLVLDSSGNLVVADTGNGLLRKVTPEGVVSTLASLPGPARTGDSQKLPQGLAIDASDTVYVADAANNSIYTVSATGKTVLVAGNSFGGSVDGPVAKARFRNPQGIAVNTSGTIFIADTGNNLIRKITPDGMVSTVAGSGEAGTEDGQGGAAQFDSPAALELGNNGVLFVSENHGHRIRRVSLNGTVTTVAGTGGTGVLDGPGNLALFNSPAGMAIDADGALLVVDSANNAVRKVVLPAEDSGSQLAVTTWAGNGVASFKNAYGPAAGFNRPGGIAFDGTGNLYVADTGNNRIRKVAVDGTVTTVAGTGSAGSSNGGFFFWEQPTFNRPESVAVDSSGTLFITDTANNLIRKIDAKGEVTTYAGDGRYWSANGHGTSSSFTNPAAIAVDPYGTLYVVENGAGPGQIRQIAPDGRVTTLKPQWAPDIPPGLNPKTDFSPAGLAVNSLGDLFVSTRTSPRILRITRDGLIHVLAGSGTPGSRDGKGPAASFQPSAALALDHFGNVYVADTLNNQIRRITPDGNVTTLPAQVADDPWLYPSGIAVATDGTVLVADSGTHRIRKIEVPAPSTDFPVTLAALAKQDPLNFPGAVVFDGSAAFYLVDGNEILKMTPGGAVSSFAGSPKEGSADGKGSSASFRHPQALALDSQGTLYVADTGNNALRMVTRDGTVTTLSNRLRQPLGVAVNKKGRIFVSDTGARTIVEFTGNDLIRGKKISPQFTPRASGLENPRALASDGLGNLWVADGNRIKRLDPAGLVVTVAGSGSNGALDGWGTSTSFATTVAMVSDRKGDVFVVDQGYGKVRRINTEGVVSTVPVVFDFPSGIALDAQGRLWVTEALKQRLEVLIPDGTPASPALVAIPAESSTEAQPLVHRTIDFGAGLQAWAGIKPTLRGDPLEFWPSIPGSSPRAFYAARDDRYLYWMMTLADGRPRGSNSINYALEVFQRPDGDQVTARIDGWSHYVQPVMLLGGPSRSWQDIWRSGTQADRSVGEGYLQARFPISVLDKYFVRDANYQIMVHVYRGSAQVPYREGPRLGSATLQY